MADWNAYTDKYGFEVDPSDRVAYEQGRLSDADITARMDRKNTPTLSHDPVNGRGGDADLDGNGVLDEGWVRNPDPAMGRAVVRTSELPSLSALIRPPRPTLPGVGYADPTGLSYGNDMRLFPIEPRRFTTMPVGRALADLLRV